MGLSTGYGKPVIAFLVGVEYPTASLAKNSSTRNVEPTVFIVCYFVLCYFIYIFSFYLWFYSFFNPS
jgi:hypothetical protein